MDVRENTVFIILSGLVTIVAAQNYYVAIGSTVLFECPFNKGENSFLDWEGPQYQNKLSTDGTLNPNLPTDVKERLKIVANKTIGQYNLQVSNVMSGDNGSYYCQKTENGSIHRNPFGLYFPEPPTGVFVHNVQSDNRVLGIEGKDLNISCTAVNGIPPPEVTLSSAGVIYKVGKQTVNHLFKDIDRSFDLRSFRCQANNSVLPSPQVEFNVYLQLKPLQPKFDPDPVNTEETTPLVVSCTSAGSRPQASFQWTIGQNNVTSNAKTQSQINTADYTYTVTSTLNHTVNRTHNGKNISCGAYNNVSITALWNSTTLTVKFAPNITVKNGTYNQTANNRTMTCIPDGNPTTYTFYKWQHKSKYGELIRELDGDQNGVLTLPNVLEQNTYQDSGEYVCFASNGIKGRDGIMKQKGSGYIRIIAQPVFTNGNNDTEYGEFGKDVDIHVYVYSDPKYIKLAWYITNTQISNSTKYTLVESEDIVHDTFQGIPVQLDGYRVTLAIKNLVASDFNVSYRVDLSNGVGQHVVYTTLLLSASAPQTPVNLTLFSPTKESVLVQWESGYNGGHVQTFVIEYRVNGSYSWKFVKIQDTKQKGTQTYTLTGLQDGTLYELRMYAENKFNKSLPTETVTIETIKGLPENQAATLTGPIIGGVAGGLVAILIILGIIWLLLLRRKHDTSTQSKAQRSSSDSEVPDGLQHNILYQSAGSDFKPLVPKVESGRKNQKPNASVTEYAEVQKSNAVYAEVSKTVQKKNVQEKKQKDKKNRPKKPYKKAKKAGNNNQDGEYANAGMSLKDMGEEEYANAGHTSGPSTSHKNQQGLEYADLSFTKQIPEKGKKPVIHGVEDRTLYSEVDHSKKAPPPPQESAYEETNFKLG